MDPTLLASLAVLAGALPGVIDEKIKDKVADPKLVALYTMIVGVVFGALITGLKQLAGGVTLKEAGIIAGSGLIGGIGAGLSNLYATSKGLGTAMMLQRKATAAAKPADPPAAVS